MITSYLQGGLGNQLFQISAAISLALENNDIAVFDKNNYDLPNQGSRCESYLRNIFRNLKFSSNLSIELAHQEPSYCYQKIPYQPNLCLVGYFQSEKYFVKHHDIIQQIFSVDKDSLKVIEKKYSEILKKNPISLHVRRGDYKKFSEYHPLCSMGYYEKAISYFPSNSFFLVFSDDMEWCKQNFVQDNFSFAEGNKDYIDFYLMSLCKSAIMANSSFSWWAAWLGEKDTVIAPDRWFGKTNNNTKDLLPVQWIVL